MNEIVKPAFIRWLSDLMKADNIIAPDEIKYLEDMCEKYNITELDIERAQSLSLSESCNIIKNNCRPRIKKQIVNHLIELSLNDGACAREEALLILALKYSLVRDTSFYCDVVSFKSPHIDFVDSQVLFIEPHESLSINRIISKFYKTILNEMRIGGFDFIYIPYVSRHYRETDSDHLSKIIKYLAPTLSENETSRVKEELCQMSTRTFYNEILKEKLGIDVQITHPSLLIKVGNSYVNGERISNFLLMKVNEEIVDFVRDMMEYFLDLQSSPTITIKNYNETGGNFIYSGFYKTIFDLVTYRKGIRNTIVFQHNNIHQRIKVIGGTECVLEMGMAASAFYEFLIKESLSDNKGISFNSLGLQKKKEIQNRFAQIYNSYIRHQMNVPDITETNTRNPLLSKIRKAIRNCEAISEKRSFLPVNISSKIFVPIDAHHFFVNENN